MLAPEPSQKQKIKPLKLLYGEYGAWGRDVLHRSTLGLEVAHSRPQKVPARSADQHVYGIDIADMELHELSVHRTKITARKALLSSSWTVDEAFTPAFLKAKDAKSSLNINLISIF